MDFAEGYLNALSHIARLCEVDTGWTPQTTSQFSRG